MLVVYYLVGMIVALFFSCLFFFLSFILGKRVFLDFEKSTPFECGFDPVLSARLPFSMRFFLLAVLFLIFDVEIVLLMPVPICFFFSSWVSLLFMGVFFVLVLLIGLFHEWKEGSLNWVY